MGSSKEKKEKSSSKDKKEKKEKSSSKDRSSKQSSSGSGGASSGSISCEAASAATAAAAAAGVAAGLAAASAAQAQSAAAAAPPPPPARPSYRGGYGASALGSSGMVPSGLGGEALYLDYRRCMGALERTINGDLAAKRVALAEAARRIEENMEEVNRVSSLVHTESEADHAGISERLESATRVKLSMLGQQLSSLLIDLEAIDNFVGDVAGIGSSVATAPAAAPPPANPTGPFPAPAYGAPAPAPDHAAASALALLQRQPELMARASRLLTKPVPSPDPVATGDLPREAAQRHARLERAEVHDVYVYIVVDL